MNELLKGFIESRDDALVAYSLTGETVDRARYNKSVRLLREFCKNHEIEMDERDIDIIMYESMTLKKEKDTSILTLDDMDDNIEGDYL